jgi:hypothetical protein
MLILLTIHSIVRWIITLVALALIVRLAWGLAKKLPFDKTARALTAAFSGLMDAQMLLGILFLLVSGFGLVSGATDGFPRYRWEHAVAMTLAVIVAHLPARWKNAADNIRTRNTLIAVVIALLIVFLGIMPLGGWTRWWNITF